MVRADINHGNIDLIIKSCDYFQKLRRPKACSADQTAGDYFSGGKTASVLCVKATAVQHRGIGNLGSNKSGNFRRMSGIGGSSSAQTSAYRPDWLVSNDQLARANS